MIINRNIICSANNPFISNLPLKKSVTMLMCSNMDIFKPISCTLRNFNRIGSIPYKFDGKDQFNIKLVDYFRAILIWITGLMMFATTMISSAIEPDFKMFSSDNMIKGLILMAKYDFSIFDVCITMCATMITMLSSYTFFHLNKKQAKSIGSLCLKLQEFKEKLKLSKNTEKNRYIVNKLQWTNLY